MLPEYLSASRIVQYLMCPLKYKLQYEDKAGNVQDVMLKVVVI